MNTKQTVCDYVGPILTEIQMEHAIHFSCRLEVNEVNSSL